MKRFLRFAAALLLVGHLDAGTTTTQKFGTSNQTITITIASLANTSSRASTVVDNTSNNFFDALVFLKVKTGASGTAATGYLTVFVYGTADGGTTYTENASGSDAAITLTSPPNALRIGSCNAVANATTYYCGPFSVRQAFGGNLPDHWGVILQNNSGNTLDGTGSNHAMFYQGIYAQTN